MPHGPHRKGAGQAALTIGALGVVFGDIGTSPLYALHTVFGEEGVAATRYNVFGVLSLVVWSVTMIVTLKYLTFIMRADNEGEGGIMALISLVQGTRLRRARLAAVLIGLGIFGAALFYGDGMITPAISVLSAVEGLKVISPSLASLVIPITLTIIVVLFSIQRFGTGAVGRLFGPIMGLWFVVLALLGVGRMAGDPSVLKALSPTYAIGFLGGHPGTAFKALGGVVLTITGAEALYADMGHFGRTPIRRAWGMVVFPALMLDYLGQGALVLHAGHKVSNPFFELAPSWGRIPLLILATAATIIASQAVISGAFSVTRQAVQLGFLPRLRVLHTSQEEIGQVYAPAVNWAVFAAVVALVVGFGSSSRLASAYGVAVTGTLAIDTTLFFVVVRARWRKPWAIVALGVAVFLTIDLLFLSANIGKIAHGGWFPLAVAIVVFTVLTTWERGRLIVTVNRTAVEGPLRSFIDEVHDMDPPVQRVPGTAVFLHAGSETAPLAMRANIEHNHSLHEAVVICQVQVERVPRVHPDQRLERDDLGYDDDGITHLRLRYGFSEQPNIPQALQEADKQGLLEAEVDLEHASYFLSRMTIQPTARHGMARWRKKIFVTMSRNAANAADYFGLPGDRVVTMGSHVEL